jgi:hypothetical protein
MKGIALGLVFIAFSFAVTWLLGGVLRDFADCTPDEERRTTDFANEPAVEGQVK